MVPGYLLSRYYPPLPANNPGTLYSANLLALPGVVSDGVGSATLRVNAAGTQATLSFTITNLVGTPTGQSINSDPYLNDPAELIFDISAAKPQPNGSYLWNIKATGPLQTNDILEIITEGKAAIVIESTAFANGEIGGNFTLANGSQTFTPPPAPPAWTDDSANPNAAARFLTQATFGASSNDIAVRAIARLCRLDRQSICHSRDARLDRMCWPIRIPIRPICIKARSGSMPGGRIPSPRRISCASASPLP